MRLYLEPKKAGQTDRTPKLADKARRETAAAAAGEEQIIAAKAQAESMKHILPSRRSR